MKGQTWELNLKRHHTMNPWDTSGRFRDFWMAGEEQGTFGFCAILLWIELILLSDTHTSISFKKIWLAFWQLHYVRLCNAREITFNVIWNEKPVNVRRSPLLWTDIKRSQKTFTIRDNKHHGCNTFCLFFSSSLVWLTSDCVAVVSALWVLISQSEQSAPSSPLCADRAFAPFLSYRFRPRPLPLIRLCGDFPVVKSECWSLRPIQHKPVQLGLSATGAGGSPLILQECICVRWKESKSSPVWHMKTLSQSVQI